MAISNFKTRSRGLAVKLRGTNQQTDNALFHLNPKISGPNVDRPSQDRRIQGYDIGYARIQNRSSAALSWYGIGGRLPNYLWQGGLFDDGVYTDDTTAMQDTTTNDFALGLDADNNTGFTILSKVPFNVLTINVSTQDAGTQTGRITYSIGTGSTLGVITNPYVAPPAQFASGENIIAFEVPQDWVVTDGTEATGVPAGYYMLNVEQTTAAATAALGKALEVWYFPWQGEVLADNAVAEITPALSSFNIPYADALGVGISTITAIQSSGTIQFASGGSVGGI